MWFTCRTQYGSKLWMMMLLAMSNMFFQITAWEWIFDLDLNVGDSCHIRTGEPGKCTLLKECDPYYKGLQKKTIEYSFLVRCSFIRFDEIICCPLEMNIKPWKNGVNVQWPNAWATDAEWIAPTNQQGAISQNIVLTTNSPATTRTVTTRNENERPSQAVGDSCHIRTGEPGKCTLLKECDPYYKGLQKKTIEYSFLVRCSFIRFDEIICCPLEMNIKPWKNGVNVQWPNAWATDAEWIAPTNQQGAISQNIVLTTNSPATTRTVTTRNENERPSQAACRSYAEFNQASLTFHILDGTPVAPGDFPHMGALVYPSEGGEAINVRCGSSLISNLYVMTAAHCVSDPILQPTMVRFGVVDLTSTDDGLIPVDAQIEEIFIHPDYRSYIRYHDIAIIKLQQPVEYTPYIRPACLYSDLADIDSSTELTVIGWGVTDVQTRSRSSILLAVNLTSVPLMECNRSFIEMSKWHSRYSAQGLDEGQYCAFDAELHKDACNSDSGGPLQLLRNKQSSIVGVVSFGQSCATAIPGLYARVAYYLSWIESIVWPPS